MSSWIGVSTLILTVGSICPSLAADRTDALLDLIGNLPTSKTLCGATVADAETGDILFAHNADTLLIPASNAKLFIMAAALDLLGTEFEFRTSLVMSGDDLVVIGSGDPAFGDPRLCEAAGESVIAEFERWASALLGAGRRTIAGDLILDESIFDRQYVHPDWDPGDLQKWYAAPVGALNLNDNCLDITVRPGDRPGAAAIWEVIPPTTIVEIDNRCKTQSSGRPVIHKPGRDLRYIISGGCDRRWPFPPVAVSDPGAIFGDVLKNVLTRRGITIEGTIRRVDDRSRFSYHEATVIAQHTTSLADVLARIGKDSQNLFAECLWKRLGVEWELKRGNTASAGSWANGREAVRGWLGKLYSREGDDAGDAWAHLILADGSGLSRRNRATSRQIVGLLCAMHGHLSAEVFADSLSIAGLDGSLKRNKRLSDLTNLVRAKTGTLTGVRSLSGYVDTRSGRRLAFSVIFNGITGPSRRYQELHDGFCRVLATWP